MRVKQTAKKITTTGEDVENDCLQMDQENCNNTGSDNVNGLSDNEVEFVVECRRDLEGNQFLLDGTPVIEPAPVTDSSNQNDHPSKQSQIEEICFSQFIKEIQTPSSDTNFSNSGINQTTVKRSNQGISPFLNPQFTVKCTACNSKFNPFIGTSLHKHPVLGVILCQDCIENQKDKYFIIDEEDNKETLCRWCVEGGSLICCDFCSKSYCKTCIKRNLGRTVLAEILNQDDSVQWKCFSCDPTPIKTMQEAYIKVYNDLASYNENRRKALSKANKKPVPRIDSLNKKRSISKAFPSTTPKVINIQQSNPNLNTLNLLTNMEGFGTEWYMRNVNMESILTGIDKVDSRTLLNAINATKKCIEAFYSDIRNLENEISKAASSADILTIVSMFKSVYRHHIFNRFCQVQSRIEEDKRARFVPQTINGGNKKESDSLTASTVPSLMINSVVSTAVAPSTTSANRVNNSFTPNLIAKGMRQMSNGERNKSLPIMYSIDLTDDTDRTESPSKRSTIENPTEDIPDDIQTKPKEIVDLCNDDDSASISYPVVRMNVNNQLFGAN